MQIEPEITYHHIDPPKHLRERVDREIKHLNKLYPDLFSCSVVVNGPEGRRRTGGLSSVNIHLTVPGVKEISVSHKADDNHAHEDIMVTVRDAFRAAERQLKKIRPTRREKVRGAEEAYLSGKGARFMVDEKAGFITAQDGRDYYFQERSVSDAKFDGRKVGDEVMIREQEGEKGPIATNVHLRRQGSS